MKSKRNDTETGGRGVIEKKGWLGHMPGRRSRRLLVASSAGLLMLTAAAVWGQTAPAPAPEVIAASEPAATLPAGHPPLDQLVMPASGMEDSAATLPAGHPDIGSMTAGGGGAMTGGGAATATALSGTLNIAVVAGSADPTSTANESVTVELYRDGVPATRMELKTDAEGKLTVPNIPLMPPVDVVVSIHHAGLLQQAEAPPLTTATPVQSVQMKVFEPTEEKPTWSVAMQHIIVEYAKDGTGATVTEMLSTNNPADRVWIGTKLAGTEGAADKRVTLALAIPPDADQIGLGGAFDENDTRIVGDLLVTGSALFPGRSEFRMSYTLPVKKGTVELPIVAPAAVGSLIVFVPADETQVTATGLDGGQAVSMGQGMGSVRMYRAQNLAAGATVKLAISGIKVATADSAMPPTTGWNGRNVAIGAAFLLVLVGAALMLMKKPKAEK